MTATIASPHPDRSDLSPGAPHGAGAGPAPVFWPASEVRRRTAAVEIVIPVYDEEAVLERSVHRLCDYLDDCFPLPWLVTVADNASTDSTWARACRLVGEIEGVQALRLEQKGRGRALRAAWSQSPAPVVAYMDVDLSTRLDALLPLVAPLLSGHSDVSIGTRLASSSQVVRGARREAISRTYNRILRTTLRAGFSDAQCGFKALRTDVAVALLPLVEDESWFFDTELLVLAEHNHLRIHEVPVDWVDDPDSTVDVVQTATDDLRGVWRLARRFGRGEGAVAVPAPERELAGPEPRPDDLSSQLVRFAGVGGASTALFALLFAALRPGLGTVGADIAALTVCAVANTAAHRRLTFARRGRPASRPHPVGMALVTGSSVVVNLLALVVADRLGLTSTPELVAALVTANALAATGRFLALRSVLT